MTMLRLPVLARLLGLAVGGLLLTLAVGAQTRDASRLDRPQPASTVDVSGFGVVEWLQRMHAASRQRNYVGTFVVSAPSGDLSSARIWHACEGELQMERVEALSGLPRSTMRRNEQVMTFLPDARVIKSERRENLELFPNLVGAPDSSVGEHYGVRLLGRDRVAGFEADVVQLVPRDQLRFGYRVWSERRTGLVMKLQTLDASGQAVEQSAFSELQLDAPLKMQAMAQMMTPPPGFRIEQSTLERTTAQAKGWGLRQPVAGFRPISCYRRPMASAGGDRTMQWTFSDGLASVSLFVAPYDGKGQGGQRVQSLGATYTLTRRLTEPGGDWWLTAVGEVPPQTLDAFARQLVRLK